MATPTGYSRRRDAFGVAMSSLRPPKDMATRQGGRGSHGPSAAWPWHPAASPSETAHHRNGLVLREHLEVQSLQNVLLRRHRAEQDDLVNFFLGLGRQGTR